MIGWWRLWATADEPDTTQKIRQLKALLTKARDEKKRQELAARVVRFPGIGRGALPRKTASR